MGPSGLIVVTGATGAVGRRVVEELLSRGEAVRALSRRPEIAALPDGLEAVRADLSRPMDLATAFADARQLILLADPSLTALSAAAGFQAGVEHVVLVSSAAVTAGYDTTWNYVAEQAVRTSGMAWTITRPGEYMLNALHIWGPSIRQRRRVVEPFPEQVGRPIHEHDVADLVVADLLEDDRRGRIDTIVGPGELSKRQHVEAIAATIGEPITIDEVTPAEARRFYRLQGGFAADQADFLFGFESYDGVEGEYDEPLDQDDDSTYQTITHLLGRPARTFADWARDHTAEFSTI